MVCCLSDYELMFFLFVYVSRVQSTVRMVRSVNLWHPGTTGDAAREYAKRILRLFYHDFKSLGYYVWEKKKIYERWVKAQHHTKVYGWEKNNHARVRRCGKKLKFARVLGYRRWNKIMRTKMTIRQKYNKHDEFLVNF